MLHPFHLLMLPDQQFLDVMICRSRFNVDFLEVIQWKRTQFSDIYRLCRRIQFLNRQKSKNSMSLSFLVLLVSLSNFIGSFDMLAAHQTFLYCWFFRVVQPLVFTPWKTSIILYSRNPSPRASISHTNPVRQALLVSFHFQKLGALRLAHTICYTVQYCQYNIVQHSTKQLNTTQHNTVHYTICFLGNLSQPDVKTVLKIERYAQRLT